MTSTLLAPLLLSQAQRPSPGLVRRQDWDSLSDWGQLVHALKPGSDASPVGPWVGALEAVRPGAYASLGLGVDNAR
jgi:hypothetical protein